MEDQPKGGWESFLHLSPEEKLKLYRLGIKESGFREATGTLRPRQLFMFAGLGVLDAAYKEAVTLGLVDSEAEPSLEMMQEATSLLLPWENEEQHQKILESLKRTISHGITYWEFTQLESDHSLQEGFIGAMRNLVIVELPVRNDLSNPYFNSPLYLRRTYGPTVNDRKSAWNIAIAIGRHLQIITEEEMSSVRTLLQETKGCTIWQEGFPLFVDLQLVEQKFNEREEIIPGFCAVIVRVSFQIPDVLKSMS